MKGYKAVIVLVILTIIAQLFAYAANWAIPFILDALLDALDIDNFSRWLSIATNIIYLVSKLSLLIAYAVAAFGLARGEKSKAPLLILAISCLLGMTINLGNIITNIWALTTEDSYAILLTLYSIIGVASLITTTVTAAGLIWLAAAVRPVALRITSIIFAITQIIVTLFYRFASPHIWEYITESTNRILFTSLYQSITFVFDFGPELLFFAAFIHFAYTKGRELKHTLK